MSTHILTLALFLTFCWSVTQVTVASSESWGRRDDDPENSQGSPSTIPKNEEDSPGGGVAHPFIPDDTVEDKTLDEMEEEEEEELGHTRKRVSCGKKKCDGGHICVKKCHSRCLKTKAHEIIDVSGLRFHRHLVGVAFEPYWGRLFPESPAEYPMHQIKSMLRIIHKRFRHISTYSMGTIHEHGRWEDGLGNCRIARAAAELNHDEGKDFLVNIGVYQHPGKPALQAKEIRNAIEAARDANNKSNGTVWGITFTNEYFQEVSQAGEVLGMIGTHKREINAMNIVVGTRTQYCYQVYTGGKLKGVLEQMARELDFIYCNVYAEGNQDGAGGAVTVGHRINRLRSAFHAASNRSPPIDFRVGETGWASHGATWQKTPNNMRNMVRYWTGMNEYAAAHDVQIQMFAAIDEDWKGKNRGVINPDHLGEAHYGWWKKKNDNQNDNTYIEKASEKEERG